MKFTSQDVARYYDRNTESFLAYGEGGARGVIHRAVWGRGVETRGEALRFVEGLLLGEIARIGVRAPRVLDLGCGVGASLCYLVARSEAHGFGITNSSTQFELARDRMPPELASRIHLLQGDFCADALPGAIDLAYGIESFVQAPDAVAFFERAARALVPGGRLALCDDFLASAGGEEESGWVEEFRRGWHASSLLSPEAVDALAAHHGLDLLSERDLTPYLELDRPRDRAVGAFVALTRPFGLTSPRWSAFLGGNALRQCLKRGIVRYRFRVWRKG